MQVCNVFSFSFTGLAYIQLFNHFVGLIVGSVFLHCNPGGVTNSKSTLPVCVGEEGMLDGSGHLVILTAGHRMLHLVNY